MTSPRIFTLADNRAFAAVSGDSNPIHVDPAQARRSPYGLPIVHGIQSALWALEEALPGPAHLVRVKAQFSLPLRVGDEAACTVVSESSGFLKLRVSNAGRVTADIEAEFEPLGSPANLHGWPAELDDEPCRSASLDELVHDAGALTLARPSGAGKLAAEQMAFLLGLTRLVGMRCPGLYSLFSAFQVRFLPTIRPQPVLNYRVDHADQRYARLTIAVDSDIGAGTIVAFRRPEPQQQPAAGELAPLVSDRPFAGQRALVIGGSRGLGEVTAKLLALGGAEVRLTYHVGAEDAAAVVEDIRAAGGVAEAFSYNVLDGSATLAPDRAWLPTHLYYFATSFITMNEVGQFDPALFGRYCALYVDGFSRLVRSVMRWTDGPLKVFYPSTEYLDSPATRAIEYAAAKAAGETLGDQMATAFPRLMVCHRRLPRLPTDQTLSLTAPPTARAEVVMLAHLRMMA